MSTVVSLSVVVSLSELVVEDLVHEMIVRLKRKREKMMSICLTRFPIGGYRRTQNITLIGLFYKEVGSVLIRAIISFKEVSKISSIEQKSQI